VILELENCWTDLPGVLLVVDYDVSLLFAIVKNILFSYLRLRVLSFSFRRRSLRSLIRS
jgi:hypothetical protein